MFLDVIEIWRVEQIDEKKIVEGKNGLVGNFGIMNINVSPKVFDSGEEPKKGKV